MQLPVTSLARCSRVHTLCKDGSFLVFCATCATKGCLDSAVGDEPKSAATGEGSLVVRVLSRRSATPP